MGNPECLVGKPEEYIKEKAAKLLAEFGINYPDGYIFCGNSNEAYCEIADIFYDMREEMTEALTTALDKEDMRNYSVNAHALKSNARSLGATELADIAYSHELKGKAGDIQFCRDNWDALVEVWNRTLSYLSIYLKAMNIDKGDIRAESMMSDDSNTESNLLNGDNADDNSYEKNPDYIEAKENILSLINSGMSDIAEEVIADLENEGQDKRMVESLRKLLEHRN